MTDNDNLTDAERIVFDDVSIEAAYQEWVKVETNHPLPINSRKQFLMRIRALVQAGKI